MTFDELRTWLSDVHDVAFPGFLRWWSDLPDAQRQARLDLWVAIFGAFDPATLSAATMALRQSPACNDPFGRHMEWLRNHCKHVRSAQLGGSGPAPYMSRCQLCKDTGMVGVVFLDSRFRTPMGNPITHGQAACKCSKGTWLNERRRESAQKLNEPDKLHILPDYDATAMRPCDEDSPSEAETQQMLSDLADRKPGLAARLKPFLRSGDVRDILPVQNPFERTNSEFADPLMMGCTTEV